MKFKIYNIAKCMAISVFIYTIVSCQNNINKEKESSLKFVVENYLGEKLILPESINTYRPFSNYIADSAEISNSELKIYSHINVSCSTCIRDIKLWDSLVPVFKKYKVPIVLICSSTDKFELIKYIFEAGDINFFSYPLFLDKKNEYVKRNKFMNETQHLETVLCDKENTILLLGNPIHSKGIKDLYLNEIQMRIIKKDSLKNQYKPEIREGFLLK